MNKFIINMTITYVEDTKRVKLKINQAEFTVDIFQFIKEYGLVETDVTVIMANEYMKNCDEEERKIIKELFSEIGISEILI